MNAADGGSSQEHDFRAMIRHPPFNISLAAQIELCMPHGEDFAVLALQPADHGGTHHAGMTTDPDAAPVQLDQDFPANMLAAYFMVKSSKYASE